MRQAVINNHRYDLMIRNGEESDTHHPSIIHHHFEGTPVILQHNSIRHRIFIAQILRTAAERKR
jgi:hypothetical protein